jgi:hypothetical protein
MSTPLSAICYDGLVAVGRASATVSITPEMLARKLTFTRKSYDLADNVRQVEARMHVFA